MPILRINKPNPTALNLIGLVGLSMTLLLFRFYWTGSLTYWSLTWNLFLAFIPLAISFLIIRNNRVIKSSILLFCLIGLWLLFLPNAPYILTDLFHLQTRGGMPKWFDLLMVLAFAWTGLIFGLISLMHIQKLLNERYNKTLSWTVTLLSIVMSSFGIYLGRYLRWNSWDILTNPKPLFKDIYMIAIDPLSHPRTIGMTVTFSAFLILVYLTLYSLAPRKENTNQSPG